MTIFAVFIIALLISLSFAPGYRKGSYAPLLLFFVILFLAGLAGSYWIVPFGPILWGVSWMPLLFIMLIFAFLFAAPSPYERNKSKTNEKAAGVSTTAAIEMFVWFLLIMLCIAVLIGFFYRTI